AGDQPPFLSDDGRRPHRRERVWGGIDVYGAVANAGSGRRRADAESGSIVMADDAATVEQLRAELRQARDEVNALRQRQATLVAEAERRDSALAETLEQQTAMAEVLRII